jgi:hypothetical protein
MLCNLALSFALLICFFSVGTLGSVAQAQQQSPSDTSAEANGQLTEMSAEDFLKNPPAPGTRITLRVQEHAKLSRYIVMPGREDPYIYTWRAKAAGFLAGNLDKIGTKSVSIITDQGVRFVVDMDGLTSVSVSSNSPRPTPLHDASGNSEHGTLSEIVSLRRVYVTADSLARDAIISELKKDSSIEVVSAPEEGLFEIFYGVLSGDKNHPDSRQSMSINGSVINSMRDENVAHFEVYTLKSQGHARVVWSKEKDVQKAAQPDRSVPAASLGMTPNPFPRSDNAAGPSRNNPGSSPTSVNTESANLAAARGEMKTITDLASQLARQFLSDLKKAREVKP